MQRKWQFKNIKLNSPKNEKEMYKVDYVKNIVNIIYLCFMFVILLMLFSTNSQAAENYIYFDLTAGPVTITATTYSGKIFKTTSGTTTTQTISGTHSTSNKYYVYQSNSSNKAKTGLVNGTYVLPSYSRVKYNNQAWGDFITNHPSKSTAGADSVDEVISAWGSVAKNATTASSGAAVTAGRTPTANYISITGDSTFDLSIDNLWSSYQPGTSSNWGAISFVPASKNSTLTLRIKGDNRFGNIHCATHDGRNGVYTDMDHTSKMIVTTVSGNDDATLTCANVQVDTNTNSTSSAIGGTDTHDHAVKMYFEQGTVYAGSAYLDFCTAIGGGGNGDGRVTISGGRVTAVHSSTGSAIGGGCGTRGAGGYGEVNITGGSVYAYSYSPYSEVYNTYLKALPTAIGGGSSGIREGGIGIVKISGTSNVFAYSEVGTAIGGGGGGTGYDTASSERFNSTGGVADISITGGTVKSVSGKGSSIGGGGRRW